VPLVPFTIPTTEKPDRPANEFGPLYATPDAEKSQTCETLAAGQQGSDDSGQNMNFAVAGRRFMACARHWRALVLAVWLSAIGMGFAFLLTYESTAGPLGEAPRNWPLKAPMARPNNATSLIFFAHPRCPCTRASLRELALVMASGSPWGKVWVVFVRPHALDDGLNDLEEGSSDGDERWTNSDLVRTARGMTGVEVVWDDGGQVAGLFRSRTSGHVLLYDASGDLMFSGGITALRGHEGWNAGRAAVASIARGDQAKASRTPVYGCPLTAPSAASRSANCEVPR